MGFNTYVYIYMLFYGDYHRIELTNLGIFITNPQDPSGDLHGYGRCCDFFFGDLPEKQMVEVG